MSEKRKKDYVVCSETGEIVTEINSGDRILRKKSIDSYNETTVWKMENFYKGHTGEIAKWNIDLSQTEKAFLFSVAPYISYDDCHLQFKNNSRDIGTEDFVEITNMSRKTVYATIKSLIAKDILYKGRNSKSRQYFVNPWLFAKGSRVNKVLKTMFKNYKIRVLNDVKWGDIDSSCILKPK
ncbi:MAG: hypothetical protein JRI72_00210 [Deltaproteobacteria bacterium]|nr:hypothetical protein [Deltaproteobacteria bacterium]